ncbi:glutamate--tRNA ligase [Wolbachia endosymbiont of Dirofilaria (Dirofilaria) immitis]|uniref:glutamate--tRNA ligase n=1 Tax=Wolbachia endosymbiont of Dirofilaria (Dirofilaria) immitis TaxID=1812115 RepID=UPI00158AFEEE|nr:glutamate--tRNA ligase [Wolbachia endosymbiont of Dirofilaria (Dirofilaria) immitis]QKX02033.1 glutamate--tRNA ligase [Wolbachia endosymbiont of Dirofilaria (Dirofilaria) immitis]
MLTRFAPSPTGYLHVGNVRTALICWMYTRSQNGKFLLRFDDTDFQRSNIKYINSIIQDLQWINIDWDLNFKQSERFERYNEVFLQLVKEGYIYACYETKEELNIKRKLQLKQGLSPIYDRGALILTEQDKARYEREKRKPHFRFKLNRNEVTKWNDEVKGKINIATSHISDPIVRREDGIYTYMLPSVIDDIDFNITHIVRGEDHITNTAAQIQMILALKAKVPTFAHLSLLHFDNSKISKRKGGLDIRFIKKGEIEPIALTSYLAKLGTLDPIKAHANMQSLVDSFDIKKFSSASTQFNLGEVYKLNSKVLQQMPFKIMEERLNQVRVNSPEFWYFIRNNIKKFSEVEKWWQICKSDIEPVIFDKELIQTALNVLPQGDCNESTLSEWVKAIRQAVDTKTKNLFMQLRLALTGKKTGPELARLLVFIGRESIAARLKKSRR